MPQNNGSSRRGNDQTQPGQGPAPGQAGSKQGRSQGPIKNNPQGELDSTEDEIATDVNDADATPNPQPGAQRKPRRGQATTQDIEDKNF